MTRVSSQIAMIGVVICAACTPTSTEVKVPQLDLVGATLLGAPMTDGGSLKFSYAIENAGTSDVCFIPEFTNAELSTFVNNEIIVFGEDNLLASLVKKDRIFERIEAGEATNSTAIIQALGDGVVLGADQRPIRGLMAGEKVNMNIFVSFITCPNGTSNRVTVGDNVVNRLFGPFGPHTLN